MFNRHRISQQARAVVTGAGSGIGRAFALEIAARGGQTVCADINRDAAAETVALIEQARGQAWAAECDVGDLEAVQALAETAASKLPRPVSLVINNAGIGTGGALIGETAMPDWQATLNVNLWGAIHGCHVFAPPLRAAGSGGIINVASAASFAAAPRMGPYNVSKAGVLALTETLAAEFAGTSLNACALCPTFVKTNIVRDGRIATAASQMAARLMRWTGVDAGQVARTTLDALDRGQLYVLPQLDARTVWRMKRYAPASYVHGTRLLARFMARDA